MLTTRNAYGDGRLWDEAQIAHVLEILDVLYENVDQGDLGLLRTNALWLMDVLFPTGFSYVVNRGPSEDVHGGYMVGNQEA